MTKLLSVDSSFQRCTKFHLHSAFIYVRDSLLKSSVELNLRRKNNYFSDG